VDLTFRETLSAVLAAIPTLGPFENRYLHIRKRELIGKDWGLSLPGWSPGVMG
jgi:hypothetical protein